MFFKLKILVMILDDQKSVAGHLFSYIWYFFYVLVFRKYNIYIMLNANATIFWSFYVFRRRASQFEITLHKTLSLNDEFNDTRKKVQRGCKPEHYYILKPPFVINLLGFYLSSYIITTSHRWRGSLWCNRMHTTPFCFFWPEIRTHGHKL